MFASVSALAVYVTDKERALEFYVGTLGFELSADLGPELCFLRSRHGSIDIYLEGGKHPASVDADSCRLSFFLRAVDSAAAAHAALSQAGVRLLQDQPEPVDDNTACFQLLDPDGNIIEVCGNR